MRSLRSFEVNLFAKSLCLTFAVSTCVILFICFLDFLAFLVTVLQLITHAYLTNTRIHWINASAEVKLTSSNDGLPASLLSLTFWTQSQYDTVPFSFTRYGLDSPVSGTNWRTSAPRRETAGWVTFTTCGGTFNTSWGSPKMPRVCSTRLQRPSARQEEQTQMRVPG